MLSAAAASVISMAVPDRSDAGAPRDGDRFVNAESRHVEPGVDVALPFFLRKAWTSLVQRTGAAPRVPFDPAAAAHNPSITWIGHSTMMVRMSGMTFLTDPMFSTTASPVPLVGPRRLVEPGVSLEQLPKIDFVTLSHNHYDHSDFDSIQALAKKGARFVVPLGLGQLVRDAGGEAVELDWWQHTKVGDVTVHCVPAQHFSRRGLTDGDRTLWAGWVVVGGDRRFYHAGDTGYFSGFREIGRRLGPIDLAAVPIGAYEPSEMMHSVHVNPEEAVRAVLDVGARRAVAMHYGTFDLADEPVDEPPRRFTAEAARHGLSTDRAWIMNIGETRRW
jgi:N-acyl-phosphatidylethanolamine-hydrolysing phospholipase D